MYVAITRAKKLLYITRAKTRLNKGRRNYAIKSRFIGEIPSYLIEYIGVLGKYQDNIRANYEISDAKNFEIPKCEFNVGDIVKHPKFGNGKIIHINIGSGKIIGEVFFIGIGKKTLDFNIAKMEKV